MTEEMFFVKEQEKSTNRCTRYLVKRGNNVMFIFTKLLPTTAPSVSLYTFDDFIADTSFAKQAVEYVINNLL